MLERPGGAAGAERVQGDTPDATQPSTAARDGYDSDPDYALSDDDRAYASDGEEAERECAAAFQQRDAEPACSDPYAQRQLEVIQAAHSARADNTKKGYRASYKRYMVRCCKYVFSRTYVPAALGSINTNVYYVQAFSEKKNVPYEARHTLKYVVDYFISEEAFPVRVSSEAKHIQLNAVAQQRRRTHCKPHLLLYACTKHLVCACCGKHSRCHSVCPNWGITLSSVLHAKRARLLACWALQLEGDNRVKPGTYEKTRSAVNAMVNYVRRELYVKTARAVRVHLTCNLTVCCVTLSGPLLLCRVTVRPM